MSAVDVKANNLLRPCEKYRVSENPHLGQQARCALLNSGMVTIKSHSWQASLTGVVNIISPL